MIGVQNVFSMHWMCFVEKLEYDPGHADSDTPANYLNEQKELETRKHAPSFKKKKNRIASLFSETTLVSSAIMQCIRKWNPDRKFSRFPHCRCYRIQTRWWHRLSSSRLGSPS